MSLLYDSHDSKSPEGARGSEPGWSKRTSAPWITGECKNLSVNALFPSFRNNLYPPFNFYTHYALAWNTPEYYSEVLLSRKTRKFMRFQKKGRVSWWTCFVLIILWIYLCILSECHSNRGMSICMTTGMRSRVGAPGRDSIHTPKHPPPHPQYWNILHTD